MEYKKLSEVCDVRDGTHDSPKYVTEGFPLVTSKNIVDGKLDLSVVSYLSQNDYDKINERSNVDTGDIIMPMIGTIGNPYLVEDFCEFAIKNVALIKFPNDDISNKYIWYYLKSPRFSRYIEEKNKGGTQKFLALGDIRSLLVPYLSIYIQNQIVERLDKLFLVIKHREQELELFDELIKARFVEMFGDIKTNEYNWPVCKFKDVSIKITDGEHGTVPRVDKNEGYLYFMARNITKDGDVDLSETSFVPAEVHEKIYKRCNPEKEDLLLVCVGATIGKCTLVPETLGEFSMARSVALIKPNREKVTSGFLINLLRSEAIQNDIDHCSHAAAQAGLYTNMINNLGAFVPPMELQMEFDSFCKQVDKSKVAVQKALDEAQVLFDSLMQQYFG